MNQDSTWAAPRWKIATALFDTDENLPTSPHSSRLPAPAPQLSAATSTCTTASPTTQSSILDHQHSSPHTWTGKSRTAQSARVHETLSRLTEPYTYAIATTDPFPSTYHTRLDERHAPAAPGDHCGPHQHAYSSARDTSNGTWRSLQHCDRRTTSSHNSDAPLTLHIPNAKDVPRSSPATTTHPYGTQTYYHPTSTAATTSLPSFVSFKEHSATRNDDDDAPEVDSMSSRLSCHLCVKLRPLVKDVADAVAELDESVRAFCNQSTNPPPEIPCGSPVRAAQWMLERLRSAKQDIQDATRRAQTSLPSQPQEVQPNDRLSNASAPNPLKRLADRWERDDMQGLKRPRSGNSNEPGWHFPPMGLPGRDERRLSIDLTARDGRLGMSPPPSEFIPGSAYPRHTSPTFAQRATRALPSPSSLVYPSSAAPSLPPPTAPSVGSPATSYQPTASIHTTSTNSVTSAHIADLQHQVTLKSLALQTLQSEYASLLQKLQRERVKSQTIEKKTSVADQEVNDLTGKNEELAEQIRALSSQLEECEKKRDAERAEAQKEKDQWGRMLEMSGRLHAKVDAERQRLLQEKEVLACRLASQEDGMSTQVTKNQDTVHRGEAPRHGSHTAVHAPTSTIAAPSGDFGGGDMVGMRREIQQLNARISALRAALQHAQRNTRETREQSQRTISAIEAAIENDDALFHPSTTDGNRMPSGPSTPARLPPVWSPRRSSEATQAPQSSSGVKLPKPTTLDVYHVGGKVTTADISMVARARSPAPEEGISVQTTTSTPEELIRALGPIPEKHAPSPSYSFTPSYYVHHDHQSWHSSQQLGKPATRPANSGCTPHSHHSSPGALMEDLSSGSASAGHSPQGYTSDPEASTRTTLAKPPPSLSELPRLNTSNAPLSNQVRDRDSGYHSGTVMLPPPRPGTSSYLPRTPL